MKFWKWLQETPTRKLWILVTILLAVVIIMAINGCSGNPINTPLGQIPPVDGNGDGIVDEAYVRWTQQFNPFPYGTVISGILGLAGTGIAFFTSKKGKSDHEDNAEEIATLKAKIAQLEANPPR